MEQRVDIRPERYAAPVSNVAAPSEWVVPVSRPEPSTRSNSEASISAAPAAAAVVPPPPAAGAADGMVAHEAPAATPLPDHLASLVDHLFSPDDQFPFFSFRCRHLDWHDAGSLVSELHDALRIMSRKLPPMRFPLLHEIVNRLPSGARQKEIPFQRLYAMAVMRAVTKSVAKTDGDTCTPTETLTVSCAHISFTH